MIRDLTPELLVRGMHIGDSVSLHGDPGSRTSLETLRKFDYANQAHWSHFCAECNAVLEASIQRQREELARLEARLTEMKALPPRP